MLRVPNHISDSPAAPTEGATFAAIDWLADVRVIEVSTGVAAPLTGRILAELGADVIKVESRAKLDVNRQRVPRADLRELADAETLRLEGFGLLHESSASKRSVTLNLKTDAGRAAFLDLLRDADAFVQNFAPGWLERIGITIDMLLELNPRLVIMSATGYGQDGPLSQQRAYAPIMSSLAGIEGLIGYDDGDVIGASATAMADLNCSFYGAYLVLAGLLGRTDTGGGRHIDLSQTEACVALLGEAMVEYAATGEVPSPRGNSAEPGARTVLTCQSGDWLVMNTNGIATDALDQLIATVSRLDLDAAIAQLHDRGVAATPVFTPDQVRTDHNFLDRGLFQTVRHPVLGELTTTSVPWHLDGHVPAVRASSPLLGADTDAVLRDLLEMSPATIRQLDAEGALH